MSEVTRPHNPDLMFSLSWQAWLDARRAYAQAPDGTPDERDKDGYTVEQRRLLARMDIAEHAIQHARADTVCGILPKLLLALHYASDTCDAEEAIMSGDLQQIYDLEEHWPWSDRMVISAIKSIAKMEAKHGNA